MTALGSIVAATPATSIQEVLARMMAIDAALPRADGVSCFNRLYLEVTRNVQASVGQATFADVAFLTRLDVDFANLYFAALLAWETKAKATPRAWAPLFEARAISTIAPLQFALAGMNAHINRDLPAALVQTFAALGLAPSLHSPQHRDFQQVNALLATTEQQVKDLYFDELMHTLDVAFANVDDVAAMWSVAVARDAAWTNGEVMWHLRGIAPVAGAYLITLDRTVGFASRGLLVPTGKLAGPV